MKSVGTEFEKTPELAGRCGRPEREFLHEGCFFGGYEGFKSFIKGGEVGVAGDRVEGSVVAVVTLVFPDVNFDGQQRKVGLLIEKYQKYHSLRPLFSSFLPGGRGSP